MSEEIKQDGNGKELEEKKQQPLTITITFTPEGKLSVQAPGNGQIYDEAMCDYMMKKASRFIENHNVRAMQSKIIPAHSSFTNRIKGAFGKK